MDMLSAFLLAGAVAVVAITAAPALFRAAGVSPPEPTAPFASGRSNVDRPRTGVPHPFIADDDDDVIDDAAPSSARIGLARAPLVLLSRGSETARVVGHVSEGEPVMIVREAGDWVLVVYGGADDIVTGWTRKSGVAIR
jgi:hypothetical protein